MRFAAAALLLVLVIVATFHIFKLAHPADPFMVSHVYRPACGNSWLALRREECQGLSRGKMPSIDGAPHMQPTWCRAGCDPWGPGRKIALPAE